ncbi:MAG TPA: FAD-dependent oxidoreductase [Streptosporangiaceae bacterium]|nr:FAD-dependent oxidoreductase [Streptosporangiaceae bacterium]
MAMPGHGVTGERSEIVVIGGGVLGCSIAYQLARRGRTDVTVLERRRLTEGSTWHAAGLVGQLRSSSSLTELMRSSVSTYSGLERDTGYATGWHPVGSIRVASSDDRWTELRRLMTSAASFGFDAHLISPAEAAGLFPLLSLEGVRGAVWVPTDGYADPSQLTHSFATGARALGVRIAENCVVTSIERTGRRVVAVGTNAGRIECDVVVNATGMWGSQTARLAGTDVAVAAVEHQYVVTEPVSGLPASLPTLRDPDGRFYVKPETGGLVIGGWEDGSRVPWRTVPLDLGPELFPPDHERFAPLALACARRIPATADIGIRAWVNGPIPFSPDAEPLMGRTEELDNLFHCCGFSAGIAAAGGAGHAMASWIIDGDPGLDLWPFDVSRFGQPHNVPGYLERRCVDAYAHYYQVSFPNSELAEPRGQRRSPLHDVLRSRGAVFGAKFGWERANWFAPGRPGTTERLTFGRSNAWASIEAEHHAVRRDAGLIDLTSFAKYEISGPGALPLLQKLAGADLDVASGTVVYTQLLSERGGIEADVTVTRLGDEQFYLVTGAGFGRHDIGFVLRYAPDDGSVIVRDVTSAHGVLALCGPRAREIAQRISHSDLTNAAFRYMSARRIDLGHAPVLALRVSYVGELGWEFHVPVEYARDLYDRLHEAGAAAGLRDVGYRAVSSLRLEKQYLAWAADIRSGDNPYAAGLGFAVRPDKPGLLAGPALRKIRAEGPSQRLSWFTADAGPVMHGGELLAHPAGDLAVSVRSAGYGYTVSRNIFSAYLPAALAGETGFIVEIAGDRHRAIRHDRPLYDPEGTRIRS